MSLPAAIPAPLFEAPSHVNPKFAFSSLGGYFVLLAILPPPGEARDEALRTILRHRDRFSGNTHLFFGVLPDSASFEAVRRDLPFRWFNDDSGAIRKLYRAENEDGTVDPQWVAIDPSMRIISTAPLHMGEELIESLLQMGAPDDHAGVPMHAPVLIVPRIFEPEMCRRLIDLYEQQGGKPSGVMREVDGKTVGVLDSFKNRNDAIIHDEALQAEIRTKLGQRLAPQMERAFLFRPTRIERYIVACYDAQSGGYFKPHRDNTTAGTAHRQFAVSINLNAEEFEGGDLRFPEFGSKTYRPPTGGAVVFACGLLHEATPVTRGVRYACLPFLFNEAAQQIRERNRHLVVPPTPAEPAAVQDTSPAA